MPENSLTLGDKIRIARKRKGLTLEGLAEGTAMSKQQIAAWEGDLHDIRMESLERLVAALGISTVELLSIGPDADSEPCHAKT